LLLRTTVLVRLLANLPWPARNEAHAARPRWLRGTTWVGSPRRWTTNSELTRSGAWSMPGVLGGDNIRSAQIQS